MQETVLIPIFIPVYNAGAFLKPCLDSVISQTYSKLEIYIYDDGSSDGPSETCEMYAQKDERIRLIKGIHGKALESMNTFLRVAKGDYIAFLDHDDYIGKDYLEKVIERLLDTNADCAVTSYTAVDEEENILPWSVSKLEDGVCTREQCLRDYLTTNKIEGFRWNKIFRKEIYENFSYPDKWPADVRGAFDCLCRCKSIVYIDYPQYFYRQSAGSEVASFSLPKLNGALDAIDNVSKKAAEMGFEIEAFCNRTWRYVWNMHDCISQKRGRLKGVWGEIKALNTWDTYMGCGLFSALRALSGYHGTASKMKLYMKCIIVYIYLGGKK